MLNKLKKLQAAKQSEKGFTIIEVMIVLAIAGLIILIVFLAVPALQRNSRNTQRKNDVQVTLGAISTYTTNNNGAAPTTLANIQSEVKTSFYLTADTDFAVGNNAITTGSPPVLPNVSKMYIRIGAKCNVAGDDVGGTGASSRSTAIVYAIESGSTTKAVCQEG